MKLFRNILNMITPQILKPPLVVICGGTGTGKSKLAIEIAKHYNGEVINADALQIYRGMNIATNKVTEEECQGVKHHLLGFQDLLTLDYSIHDFQKAALQIINNLRDSNKMPILVGGTNYYLESILWHKLVYVDKVICTHSDEDQYKDMSNIDLHEFLRSLDPQSAALIHPNTRRKTIRAIDIALNSPLTQHRHLEMQMTERRFPLNETVFIWVDCDLEVLYRRLDNRVDEMMKGGLLGELLEMKEIYQNISPSPTYTRGVFQAIGFKEFHDYLECDNRDCEAGTRLLHECVSRLKLANKQYVRVQNKWIKNRFLRCSGEERNIPLFRVDSSEPSEWADRVLQRAVNIVEEVRGCAVEGNTGGGRYSDFVSRLSTVVPEPLSKKETFTACRKVCDICEGQLFISLQSWEAHIRSRRHEKRARRKRMKEAEQMAIGGVKVDESNYN